MSKSRSKLSMPLLFAAPELAALFELELPNEEVACGGGGIVGLKPLLLLAPDLFGGGGSRIPPAPKPDGFCLAPPLDVSDFFYKKERN
jgi:hypothetical protein